MAGRHPRRNVAATRNTPLSRAAYQMLLGTLLGDGSMDWCCAYGRVSIIHSSKQEAYCRHKAELLADYVATPPRLVVNAGWGERNCRFTTVTSAAFEPIRRLCYRQDPVTGKYVRCVNQAWLDELTWEGISVWYQDDGTLCNRNSTRLCTHRYSKAEVDLLARMLTERGCPAKVWKVARKDRRRQYWVIRLGLDSARTFIERIRPFVHPSMAYKLRIKEPRTVPCAFCGKALTPRGKQATAEYPCCGAPDCRRAGNRLRNKKYLSEEQREDNRRRARQRYHANLETSRARSREIARKKRQDPAVRARMNAQKWAWHRRLKGTPEYEVILRKQRKQYYRRLMKDPVRRAKKNERNRRRRKNLTPAQRDHINELQRLGRLRRKAAEDGN